MMTAEQMRRRLPCRLCIGALLLLFAMGTAMNTTIAEDSFVRVSPRDARYFELSNGEPYIAIGLNMIGPPGKEGLDVMSAWMENLSANGGNFIRVWLSSAYFDVEHRRCGEYDEEKAKRIDAMLALAQKRGIRVKMCIESFRHLGEGKQPWFGKPLHLIQNGGTAASTADFFDGERSRDQFKRKLAWLTKRYGDNPTIFGWELWNEINCVAGGDYMAWTETMLAELHRLFPKNLAMQSLGSFDGEWGRKPYERLSVMPGNDVAQVHRYLDLGARFDVCRGPMDLLAANAVRTLQSYRPNRPILLAESGGVEPRHSGPLKLYEKDTAGILLHDVLFAPFFCGSAGTGHIWHWDLYVAKMNLWPHFRRFAEVVKGIDPPAERFEPMMLPHPRLRVYALKGQHTTLMWCRDSQNTWQTELAGGKAPETIRQAALDVSPVTGAKAGLQVKFYDPWENRWSEGKLDGARLVLPDFQRSIVVRLE
ncbi:MAG: cellulase family glycosylhydrolase [Planctomycetota bacterium]